MGEIADLLAVAILSTVAAAGAGAVARPDTPPPIAVGVALR